MGLLPGRTVSAVGVLFIDPLYEEYRRILALAASGHERWRAETGQTSAPRAVVYPRHRGRELEEEERRERERMEDGEGQEEEDSDQGVGSDHDEGGNNAAEEAESLVV